MSKIDRKKKIGIVVEWVKLKNERELKWFWFFVMKYNIRRIFREQAQ